MREYKTFHFQLKANDDEQGIIEGYLSVFNVVDQGKDRVIKGAFKRTIANSKKKAADNGKPYIFPMLWQHDETQPIGGVTDAYEDDYGLFTSAQFDLDTQKGREAYSGYKKGYLDQLSIGYDVIKKSYDAKGVRDLEELRLWEQSTVTFAMNEDALVTGVKANKTMPKKDFNSHYGDSLASDVLEDLWDVYFALGQAFRDAFSIGDTPMDDMKASMEQFNEAMLAMTQRGIDTNLKQYLADQQSSSSSYYGYMAADDNRERKGGMSQAKKDTIQSHIDSLHSMADEHKSAVSKHVKAMHSAADDLASVLQGSEPAYTTDHGTPEKSRSPEQAPRQDHSSSVDTDLKLNDAMQQLAQLRKSLKS